MANANEVPPDAEKLLFAVDIVNFFLNDHWPHLLSEFMKSDVVDTAGRYREFVFSGFNENIKNTIKFIDDTQAVLVRRDFLEIKNKGRISKASLIEYGKVCRECYFVEGFEARKFLMYCARVAVMACCFFSHGMKEAPDTAIDLIASAVPEVTMSSLTWDSLNIAADSKAKTEIDVLKTVAEKYSWREQSSPGSSETGESSSDSTSNGEGEAERSSKNFENIRIPGVQNEPSTSQASNAGVESLTTRMGELSVSSMKRADPGASCSKSPSRSLRDSGNVSDSPSKRIAEGSSNLRSSLGKRTSSSKVEDEWLDSADEKSDSGSVQEVFSPSRSKKLKFEGTEQGDEL